MEMHDVQCAAQHILEWLEESNSRVAFTGAGISTESGIPDFRSPGGVWTKYRTVYFDEFCESADARYEYWRQKAEAHRDFTSAEPNVTHRILAGWETAGRLRGVITQNIDGLHQQAGNVQVLELHGTARDVCCLDCGWRDQFHIHYGSRQLSRLLHQQGIQHRYEEFDDNHSAIDYRMDVSLPYLARRLS